MNIIINKHNINKVEDKLIYVIYYNITCLLVLKILNYYFQVIKPARKQKLSQNSVKKSS
jgi:hypothetical protein